MGYKLPDGRYVDERGKVHRNYNDALAESRTRQAEITMPTPTIAESARSLGNSFNNLFGLVKPIRKAVSGIIDPETAYANQWYNQGTTDRQYSRPIGPTRDIYEQPGVGYFDRGSGRFLGPGSATTIRGADIGGDGRGEQYRQQLSQYAPKAFPMTAEGQQERYFGTPEMNYVFGAQTGKGPKTAEEMSALASQAKAPTTSSLSDYYRAQSAMGRVNQADIQKMYADRPDLQKWAAANPMLAQREFIKQQGGRTMAPDGQTVMGDLGSRAQSEGGYTMEALNPTGAPDFGTPANDVPAPPTVQGANMMEAFKPGIELSAAMTAGATGMPNFQTTPEAQSPGMNFLDAFKRNPQFDAYMLGAGARLGDYFQGIGR